MGPKRSVGALRGRRSDPAGPQTLRRPATTADDIPARTRTVLTKTFDGIADAASLSMDARLFGAGLGLDSIDAIQLAAALEQEFAVTIDERELRVADFETVGTVVALVRRRLSHAAPPG